MVEYKVIEVHFKDSNDFDVFVTAEIEKCTKAKEKEYVAAIKEDMEYYRKEKLTLVGYDIINLNEYTTIK